MATIILPRAAPPVPGPVGPGPCTLAQLEQETAARVGPFALLEVLTADQGSLTVEVLKSTIDLGGYDDLYLLRREASQQADRVARVRAYDPTLGQLQPDRRYVTSPIPSEPVELHHLPPDLLRRGVRAGLRRCFCQFWLALAGADPDDPDAPVVAATGPVDLTDYSGGWLRLPQQVLDVLDPQGDGASVDGWRAYQHNGRCYLLQAAGVGNLGLTVIASRAHFTLVNAAWAPDGPLHDDDELDADVFYAAAMAHAELWRVARDRLEAVAAEGRQATQQEAAAEATRAAVANAPWLFEPGAIRRERIGPLTGLAGAGGTAGYYGHLQGALVNGPDFLAPTNGSLGLPREPGPGGRNG